MYTGSDGGRRPAENYRDVRSTQMSAETRVCAVCAMISAPPEEFSYPRAGALGQPGFWAWWSCYAGPAEEGEEALASPPANVGPPAMAMVQPMPYVAVQQLTDAGASAGEANYWTARLPDRAPR
jgi:hypothetical protein